MNEFSKSTGRLPPSFCCIIWKQLKPIESRIFIDYRLIQVEGGRWKEWVYLVMDQLIKQNQIKMKLQILDKYIIDHIFPLVWNGSGIVVKTLLIFGYFLPGWLSRLLCIHLHVYAVVCLSLSSFLCIRLSLFLHTQHCRKKRDEELHLAGWTVFLREAKASIKNS